MTERDSPGFPNPCSNERGGAENDKIIHRKRLKSKLRWGERVWVRTSTATLSYVAYRATSVAHQLHPLDGNAPSSVSPCSFLGEAPKHQRHTEMETAAEFPSGPGCRCSFCSWTLGEHADSHRKTSEWEQTRQLRSEEKVTTQRSTKLRSGPRRRRSDCVSTLRPTEEISSELRTPARTTRATAALMPGR